MVSLLLKFELTTVFELWWKLMDLWWKKEFHTVAGP